MEMDPAVHLRYLSWATQLILEAAQTISAEDYERDRGSSHGGIKGTLVHMYRADALWFSRVAGEPYAKIGDVEVPESLHELGFAWIKLLGRWEKWAQGVESNHFNTEVGYTNSAGVAYRTPLWQIVLHLVNHNTVHRGQVVTMLRQAGAKAPATDLILYYRSLEAASAS